MSDERALDAEELEQLDAPGPTEFRDPLVRREMKKRGGLDRHGARRRRR